MLASVDACPREDARERQNPRRQADTPDGPRRPGAIPRGKVDRFGGWRAAGGALLDERLEIGDAPRAGKCAFVDARLEFVFERHHQLDAFERTEPEFFDGRVRRDVFASRVPGDERRQRILARRRVLRRGAALHPLSNRGPFQFFRAFGPRKLRVRPDQRPADLLRIAELRVGRSHHIVRIHAGLDARALREHVPRCLTRSGARRPRNRARLECDSTRLRRLPERRSVPPA